METKPDNVFRVCLRGVASLAKEDLDAPTGEITRALGDDVNLGRFFVPKCREATQFCKEVSEQIHQGATTAVHNTDYDVHKIQIVAIVIDVRGADNIVNLLANSSLAYPLYLVKRGGGGSFKNMVRIRPKTNYVEEPVT